LLLDEPSKGIQPPFLAKIAEILLHIKTKKQKERPERPLTSGHTVSRPRLPEFSAEDNTKFLLPISVVDCNR
jgi:hypothetical protein